MTTVKKMKDAEKAVLQDELNYYSRLLANHYNSKKTSVHPAVQSTWTRNYGNSTRSVLKASMDQPQHYKSSSFQYKTAILHKPNQNSKIVPHNQPHTFHKQTDVLNKTAFNPFNFQKYPSKSSMVKANPSTLAYKSLNHAEKTLECNSVLKKSHTNFKKRVNCSDTNKPSASSSQALMSEMNVLLEQLKQKTKNINKTDHVSSLKKGIVSKPELKMHTNISSGAKTFSCAVNCTGQTSDKLNGKNVFSGDNSNLPLLDGKIEISQKKLPTIETHVKPLTELKNCSLNHPKHENLKIPSKIFDVTSQNLHVKAGNPDVFQVHNIVKVPNTKKLIRKRTNSFKKNGTTFASKYKVVNKNQACVQQKKLIVQVNSEVKTPVRKTPGKKHINSIKKMKSGTRLMSSKYKIINKKLPCVQSLNSENTLQGVGGNSACELSNWISSEIKSKTRKLNSKYKIVNKSGKSPTVPVSPFGKKSMNSSRKQGNFDHQGNKNLNKFCTSSFSNKNVDISSKLQSERKIIKNTRLLKQNHAHVLNLKRKKHSHAVNSFFTNSKYKTVNKQLGNSLNKIPKVAKFINVNNDQNSSIDLDLLMELAAEKECSNPLISPKKHILIKRVYKSKNVIVNKNVSSLQTRAAKMIKTKYSILNKKQTWQNLSRRAISTKYFKGHKFNANYQKKISQFYSQTNKRHFSKYKNRHISTYFDASIYRRGCPASKNRSFAVGSAQMVKTPKRFVSSQRRLFLKTQNMKSVSPISKAMASRALNRSINRVLTASVKKTSKVNMYCKFYNRFGRCNKGVKCSYVHDPSKIAICTRFLRGTCKTKNCPFSHEICPGKMAICSFFLLGSCTKIDCPYRHETLPPNAKLCKAFVQGYCPDGKQCKQAHVLFCPQFVQGHCEKGNSCPFPHPPPKGKKNVANSSEKSENLKESEELTLEKMSRYFECASESEVNGSFSVNSVAVQRTRNLPEQPSFIAL